MAAETLITEHFTTWTSALQTRSTAGRGSNGKIELYGIKKLRELILELAVRGKLVPQDPNDEPASELLKRIAAEKAELVKQGKIKPQKPLPEISEDEKPFELPKGWEWVRLGDICKKLTDGSHNPPKDSYVGYPMLSSQNIQNGFIDIDNPSRYVCEDDFYRENKRTSIQKGDILLTIVGSLGRSAVVTNYTTFVLQRSVAVLSTSLLPYFLSDYFKSITAQSYFIENGKGTAQKGIYLGQLSHMYIPVPSLAEQNRIVIKIKNLLSLCDQLEQQSLTSLDAHHQLVETLLATLTDSQSAEQLAENWARISPHFDTLFTTEASIDALKQTILQLAVMGKLVPQDPNDEPASELLKRIEQEKAQLIKAGKIKKQKPLPPISEEEKPFELPQGWAWLTLSHVGYIFGGKTPSKMRGDYWGGDISWVTPKDMKTQLITTSEDFVTELAVNDGLAKVPSRSLLFVVRSGILRRKLPVAITAIDCTVNQDLKVLIPFFDGLERYILLMMNGFEKHIIKNFTKNGTTVESLLFDELKSHPFLFPPLKEQHQIISKVDELMNICDQLKSRLQSAQQTQLYLADALTDAALN